MKKIIMTLFLCIILSCTNSDEEIKLKIPQIDNISNKPIAAGSELTITGTDLDDNPVIILNNKAITPVKISNSKIDIKIPIDATSGKLEIKFQQEQFNTETFLKILDQNWNTYQASSYFQIKFISENVGFAKKEVSNKTIIDKTLDGGNTWTTILETSGVTDFDAISRNVTYVSNGWYILKKTTDGGSTWQEISAIGKGSFIDKVFFKNELEGYISAHKSGKTSIHKTIDGGNTWTEVFSIDIHNHKIELVYHKDDTILLLDRENNKFIKTEDAGLSWNTTSSNFESSYPITYNFANLNTGWLYLKRFFDTEYELIKTTDQGNSWQNIKIPRLAETIVKINFPNELNGHLLTDKGSSLYTYDGGETWKHYHIDSEYITAATSFENTLYIIANSKILVKKI